MSQQVAPTRMALTVYKAKLVGAKKGYELLKKKSDALKVRFRYVRFFSTRARIRMRNGPLFTSHQSPFSHVRTKRTIYTVRLRVTFTNSRCR